MKSDLREQGLCNELRFLGKECREAGGVRSDRVGAGVGRISVTG